ncbi:sugar ABC transporter ATP-binding protein [Paramicrobacterium agarici]|uniref:Monosaccharide ABC transporter ATP-binding protein (CUT2 family) n=1 Tax=Paramicrobacterium agarici TaxID=630514 RepID=A0A2A9DTF7_9MICO|nr:sugar ABC transporter ATP-binding protein [Microbacterium agarici]PFG29874.1 monosaccharide ABC transporter ATP-binding protein (CUT2 family) [Microbacterium agarici]
MSQPLLTMSGISKRFGGAVALDDVHLDLYPGEVHALMGENGAGKSTLMKILSGVYVQDSGTVTLNGEVINFQNPRDALTKGIAIIHQELNTVGDMTVAENLALGQEPRKLGAVLDRKALKRSARAKLARIGVDISVDQPLNRLSIGMQQMVEIARAIAEQAKVLVLDEPTAALSRSEAQRLFALVGEMRNEGIALAYISHRMEEVWQLSDRITVLRDGKWVSSTKRGELTPEQVVQRMVGRDVQNLYVHENRNPGDIVLDVEALTNGRGIGPVDLTVRAGEVVGLVGLIGAGRTEMCRLIFGADRNAGGRISVDGQRVKIRKPIDAIRQRIGMLPESRKEQALFLDLSIRDNTAMSSLKLFTFAGVLKLRALRKAAQNEVKTLRIRSTSVSQLVSGLSGGNQQKVALSRWLLVKPKVLILDEPTRGVDIGAKQEIYRIINDLTQEGVAVLMVSSDLPEALGISDRVLVFRAGRVVREMSRDDATEEAVMMAATGLSDNSPSTLSSNQLEGDA